MRVRSKLLLAQVPLALALLTVGVVSRATITALDHHAQNILKDNHESLLAAQRMRDAVDGLRRAGSAAERDRWRDLFERDLAFQEGNITEAGERELTTRLRASWRIVHESLETGPFDPLSPSLVEVERAIRAIAGINHDAMERKSERARSSAARMTAATIAVTLFAAFLGVLGSVYFTHRLIRPLRALARAVRRFGHGDLTARATVAGNDEIVEVANEFNTMAEHLADYRSTVKSDLVATVAHELRTPLTSLRMAIHLCADGEVGPLTPQQRELLSTAREDCERLRGIVDDLLDVSRIQAGKILLHLSPVSPASLVADAAELHRPLARERRIDISIAPPAGVGLVSADPDRALLVLGNLLSNAIRHTPSDGRIELRLRAADDDVRFEVSDTGAGIAPEHLPHVFERFFQVPGAPSGGAGLGLYICKEIIEVHGGRIGVESAPGQGSLFWFTLPAVATPERAAAPRPPPRPDGRTG